MSPAPPSLRGSLLRNASHPCCPISSPSIFLFSTVLFLRKRSCCEPLPLLSCQCDLSQRRSPPPVSLAEPSAPLLDTDTEFMVHSSNSFFFFNFSPLYFILQPLTLYYIFPLQSLPKLLSLIFSVIKVLRVQLLRQSSNLNPTFKIIQGWAFDTWFRGCLGQLQPI